MKSILRSRVVGCTIVVIAVAAVCLLATDVTVKEGLVEADRFKSKGCEVNGAQAVAFGSVTRADGNYSFAAGYGARAEGVCSVAVGAATASGDYSFAAGRLSQATQPYSIAMGYDARAQGSSSVAIGHAAKAYGIYDTALGWQVEASEAQSPLGYNTAIGYANRAVGFVSTAMGSWTTASGPVSTAMGYDTEASGFSSIAFGESCLNNIDSSFAIGFGSVDLRVESGQVTVGDLAAYTGDLCVGDTVYAEAFVPRSSFYDKGLYGKALDYVEDCSKTIKVNAEGQKAYNHEADPAFLQKSVPLKDYDNYTEEQVQIPALNRTVPKRIYQTRQELGSDLGMMVAWLRQCVYELKQENEMLKEELQALKSKLP